MSRFHELDPAGYRLPEADLERLMTPALVVRLDVVRDNLKRLAAHTDGDLDRLRPHVKTAKMPAVFDEMVGFGLRHFKCATTREARCLLASLDRSGAAGDVLVAHPLVGPALRELASIARAHPRSRVSVVAEDPAVVATIPADVGVFVDLNCGMDRTGVPRGETAAAVAVALAAGRRLRGLHLYEGHISSGAPTERRARAFAVYDELLDVVEAVRAAGAEVDEIVTSGTPTFTCALAYPRFTGSSSPHHRVSPGTFVYQDCRYGEALDELDFAPAALVASRVVSHPAPERFTCDAGSKSIAAEAGDPCAAVLGRPGWIARRPSEEHLPFAAPAGDRPPIGTVLYLVPRHVCPTVNLAEQAVLCEHGRVREIVTVDARAHDLVTREIRSARAAPGGA